VRPRALHTVVETPEFVRHARSLLDEDERKALIDYMAAHPDAGVLMQGSGGARKLRWGRRGRGKSGGVRVISAYGGPGMPIFLLTVFGKGEKANLTMAERAALRDILKATIRRYREGAKHNVQGR